MNDIVPAVFVVAVAALAIALVLQVGATRRARASLANDDALRRLTERAVGAQEATEKRLAAVDEQLVALGQRLTSVERILKDAE
jgi:signal transduction histidine kinase